GRHNLGGRQCAHHGPFTSIERKGLLRRRQFDFSRIRCCERDSLAWKRAYLPVPPEGQPALSGRRQNSIRAHYARYSRYQFFRFRQSRNGRAAGESGCRPAPQSELYSSDHGPSVKLIRSRPGLTHITAIFLFTLALPPMAAAQQFDTVIRNGHIVDGTGSPWYSADIGIRNGRIAAIGSFPHAQAKAVIDASGLVVTPGFIDMLGQSELSMLVNPHVPSKIFQGITTEITGEGGSIAPMNERILAADRDGFEHYGIRPDWTTFAGYFKRLQGQGMGINLASYVGATQVRRMVLGEEDRAPNPTELERMKALVREAMQEGAVGVSTSLQYAPAPYASTEELIALAAEASKFGGIYATHMRSEQAAVLTALDEAIRIGREARVPVEIWHIKAAG